MKVITKIEFMECPDNIARVRLDFDKPCVSATPFDSFPQPIKDEIVHGKRFTTPNGVFVLGITSNVAYQLGVALTVIDNLKEEINQKDFDLYRIKKECDNLNLRLLSYANIVKSANFFKRLKYLFTSKF